MSVSYFCASDPHSKQRIMAAIHYSLSGCVSESTSDHVLFNLVSWVVGEPLTIIMLLSKTKA